MKKMISGLFVLLFLSMSVLASAEITQTKDFLENGDVVVVTEKILSNQKVSPEAMEHMGAARQVLNGAEFVPIGVTRDVKMDGWIHYIPSTTYNKVVTLDEHQNVVVKKVATVVKKGEVQFAWFIVFIMLSFVAMVVFHQEIRKDNINNSVAVKKGIVFFILNFLFLFFYILQPAFFVVGFRLFVLMTLFSLGLVLSIIGENRKVFNIFSVLFYLSVTSLLFVIYTS